MNWFLISVLVDLCILLLLWRIYIWKVDDAAEVDVFVFLAGYHGGHSAPKLLYFQKYVILMICTKVHIILILLLWNMPMLTMIGMIMLMTMPVMTTIILHHWLWLCRPSLVLHLYLIFPSFIYICRLIFLKGPIEKVILAPFILFSFLKPFLKIFQFCFKAIWISIRFKIF